MGINIHEEHIIEVALKLFQRQGIRSTSLQDVAKASGVSTKNLLQVYATKELLVLNVVKHVLTEYGKYLQLNPRLSPNATTEINNFFRYLEKVAQLLTESFLREIRKYYANTWKLLNDFKENELIPYLKENIKRGISEDYYRSDLDHDVYAQIYFLQLNSIIGSEQLGKTCIQSLLPELHAIFIRGLLNVKGLRLMYT